MKYDLSHTFIRLVFSGGVANNPCVRNPTTLPKPFNTKGCSSPANPDMVGALGAALHYTNR